MGGAEGDIAIYSSFKHRIKRGFRLFASENFIFAESCFFKIGLLHSSPLNSPLVFSVGNPLMPASKTNH